MPRALLLAVAVSLAASAPAPAAPPPAVTVTARHCTTEPAPTTPIVRQRTTRAGLRVTLVGPGRLCAAPWTVTTAGAEVVLVPMPASTPSRARPPAPSS